LRIRVEIDRIRISPQKKKKMDMDQILPSRKNLSCSRSDFRTEGSGEKPDADPVFSNSSKIPGSGSATLVKVY